MLWKKYASHIFSSSIFVANLPPSVNNDNQWNDQNQEGWWLLVEDDIAKMAKIWTHFFIERFWPFFGFWIIFGFLVLFCWTNLLCIVGELSGWGSVAVAVGDRWQVTNIRWQVMGDRWQVTGDMWHMIIIYIYIYNYFCFIFRWLYFGVGTTIRFLKPEFWESTYFYFGLENFQCSGPYLARPIKKGLFMPSYCRTPDLPIPAIPINDWKGMERLYTM